MVTLLKMMCLLRLFYRLADSSHKTRSTIFYGDRKIVGEG